MLLISVADLRGARGMRAPRGSKFFQFHPFLGNFGKIVCWRPLWGVGAPPRGNPGSATAFVCLAPLMVLLQSIKPFTDDNENIDILWVIFINYGPFLLQFPWAFEEKINQNIGLIHFRGQGLVPSCGKSWLPHVF